MSKFAHCYLSQELMVYSAGICRTFSGFPDEIPCSESRLRLLTCADTQCKREDQDRHEVETFRALCAGACAILTDIRSGARFADLSGGEEKMSSRYLMKM